LPDALAAKGRQQRDRFVPEPPEGKLEHRRRRRVQPLRVVNGDHDWPRAGEATQDGEDGERDRALLGRPPARLLE
jgi:hypothetical protein